MEIEILLSCMHQKDISLIEKNNIKSNAVIINQTSKNDYTEFIVSQKKIKFISSIDRGLTKSRNLALMYASGDICLLSDDDVLYKENYIETITKAFDALKDADIIIFDIDRTNYNLKIDRMIKIRKAPKYKSYGSVRIAFKREVILENNLRFDMNFGSGSVYSSGEESIFLMNARLKKLKIYEYPVSIGSVDFKTSTWRNGFNEKFFYDKGALLAAIYPLKKYLFLFYYVTKLWKEAEIKPVMIIKWLIYGIRGFDKILSYEEYREKLDLGDNFK